MENLEERLEKLGQIAHDNFEKSGLKRELEELCAKATAQLRAEPQAKEQILDQLKRDYYALMAKNEAAGWVDGPVVDGAWKTDE